MKGREPVWTLLRFSGLTLWDPSWREGEKGVWGGRESSLPTDLSVLLGLYSVGSSLVGKVGKNRH